MRAGEGDLRPTGTRVAAPGRLRPGRRAVGRRSRSRSAWRSSSVSERRRRGRRALPEPGRRDRVRALPRGLERARRRQPGPRRPRAGRRGARRQPPRRPAAYAIVPIDRCYELVGMIKADLGGHLGRRRRRRTRSRRSSRGCRPAERGSVTAVEHGDEPTGRRRGPDRAGVPGVDVTWVPRTRRPRRCVRPRRDRDLGPRGLHDRAHGADQHRSGAAQLRRRDARGASSTSSARPSAGRATTHELPVGAGRARSCRASPAQTTFTMPVPVHLRPRARGRQVPLQRCPTARCRSLPLHRLGALPRRRRAAAGRAHPVDVLGGLAHARRDLARDDGALLPQRRLGAAARRHGRRAARAGAPSAGCRRYDACVAELLGEEG